MMPGIFFIFHCIALFLFFSHESAAQTGYLPRRYDSLVDAGYELMYHNYERSDSLYSEAEQIIKQSGIEDNAVRWIDLLNRRAMNAYYNSKYALTNHYINEAAKDVAKLTKQLQHRHDSLRFALKFTQANLFFSLSRYDDALENFNSVETFIKTWPREHQCKRLFQIIQWQASIYLLKGEYESAINQYIASLMYKDCYSKGEQSWFYLLAYRNLATAYLKKGDTTIGLHYLFKASTNLGKGLRSQGKTATLKTWAIVLYDDFSNYYLGKKNFDSAKFYFKKALPFTKENPNFTWRIYLGLGKIAADEGKFHESRRLLLKSAQLLRNGYGPKRLIVRSYLALARLYKQQGDFPTSLRFAQKALIALTDQEVLDSVNFVSNPTLKSVYAKKEMLITLHQKAELLTAFYDQARDLDLLQHGRETNLLALQLLDSTLNEFTLEKDKVVLGEEAIGIYETSLRIDSELHEKTGDNKYVDEFFEMMDKSKSAVLLNHLKLVKSFSGIPEELQQRQHQLKAELTIAEEDLFEGMSPGEDGLKQRQVLDDLKKAHAQLFAEIKDLYPHYYNLRIANKTITLPEVQSKLLYPQQALIEYFVGDTSIYMVCVSSNTSRIYTAPADSLHEQVSDLRNRIIKGSKILNNGINKKSGKLYQRLVTPWISQLDSRVTSLIIIPHGVLSYIPFEMLSAGEDKEMLLNRFSISYAPSASLLWQQKQMHASGKYFAGFNADYTNKEDLVPLRGALQEVESIQGLFGTYSKVFINSTADLFRKQAPQFKVLHLALHSYVNDEMPLFSRLVFTSSSSSVESEITANDLYGMELHAEMAVLSACESGIGQLKRGEGMMSLSRAFMYAGVPSTVIGLWKVPDQATYLLMERFYGFLKLGQSKDLALSNAKREFIKDHPLMSSPFFWAGFVVNGKTDPVSFMDEPLLSYRKTEIIIITIALVLMSVILYYVISSRLQIRQNG
ncbi:MAG: CHAT domain-containing tetratricopeptide repeat protein [Cyclobacteriaceae bacterium]